MLGFESSSQLQDLYAKYLTSLSFFFEDFIYFQREGKGAEREGERHQCVVASHVPPNWGPGPQLEYVPWLGIELATL